MEFDPVMMASEAYIRRVLNGLADGDLDQVREILSASPPTTTSD